MYFLHNKIKFKTNNKYHLNPWLGKRIKVQQFCIAELLFFILSYSS